VGNQEIWCRIYSSEGEPVARLDSASIRSIIYPVLIRANQVEQGRPEQYCSPAEGVGHGTPLYVSSYPVAWRVELMEDEIHRGYEYVRFYWGPKKTRAWDLHLGQRDNGTCVRRYSPIPMYHIQPFACQVHIIDELPDLWQTWKFIPVNAGATFTPSQSQSAMLSLSSLPQDEAPALAPPYDGTQRCINCSHRSVETGIDGFGTTVTEVTVTTTTTRKKYRVEE